MFFEVIAFRFPDWGHAFVYLCFTACVPSIELHYSFAELSQSIASLDCLQMKSSAVKPSLTKPAVESAPRRPALANPNVPRSGMENIKPKAFASTPVPAGSLHGTPIPTFKRSQLSWPEKPETKQDSSFSKPAAPSFSVAHVPSAAPMQAPSTPAEPAPQIADVQLSILERLEIWRAEKRFVLTLDRLRIQLSPLLLAERGARRRKSRRSASRRQMQRLALP